VTRVSRGALTSASLRLRLPPFGGIAPLPVRATWYSVGMPVLMKGAHAALSPNFGAPARPAPWQATPVRSQIFLPSEAAVGAAAAAGAAAAGLAGAAATASAAAA